MAIIKDKKQIISEKEMDRIEDRLTKGYLSGKQGLSLDNIFKPKGRNKKPLTTKK